MDEQSVEILLVEGCDSDARLYLRMLARSWRTAHVTHVATLRAAVQHLTSHSVDAVLLDLELPDSSGLQTLSRLYKRATDVAIIVLTEFSDEMLGLEAIKMGAEDYLAKILATGNALERCLRYAIERKRLVGSIRQRDAELAHLSRLATMGEMASGLAHELRQPLTAIKNYAEASSFRLTAGDKASRQRVMENLAAMSQQASRCSEILQRMKDYARRSRPDPQAVSLHEIICDSLALLEQELRRKCVDVVLRLDSKLRPIWVDKIQMEQVIVNLVFNAIEAVSAPDVLRREVCLETFARGHTTAEIVVSDTGPGFEPGLADAIFEPFYTTKESGLGMGLAICRTIIETHNGCLEAALKHDGGALFRISLPLAVGTSAPSAEPFVPAPGIRRQRTRQNLDSGKSPLRMRCPQGATPGLSRNDPDSRGR